MRKLSLLLIEPDPEARAAMGGVLRSHFGIGAVHCAASLTEAVGMAIHSHDLVLTGWDTGDAIGGSLLESLRRQGARGVIVVTEANCASAATQAIIMGASDYVVRVGDYLLTLPLAVEKSLAVIRLRRERDALHRQLVEQNETLAQLLKSLEEAAATDALTGLYNRGHLDRLLEQMFDDAVRGGHELACVMFDIDRFKQLNDTLGHATGDVALVTLGQVIKGAARKMDAAARYGGDEFVVLLPRTEATEAARVAQRIRLGFSSELRTKLPSEIRDEFSSALSAGVATRTSLADSKPRSLLEAADAALYKAKRQGRDRIEISQGRSLTLAG